MTLILAFDTTTEICSVALGTEEDQLENTEFAPRQHNKLILSMIDELLAASPWQRTDLDFIAFSAGPGSFTGTRISSAVAQGIALAVGSPIISLPSSLVMAHVVRRSFPSVQIFELRRRSRQNLVYVSTYSQNASDIECLASDRLVDDTQHPLTLPVFRCSDVSVSARDVLHLARANRHLAVEPHLAVPIHIDGDTPYKPSN